MSFLDDVRREVPMRSASFLRLLPGRGRSKARGRRRAFQLEGLEQRIAPAVAGNLFLSGSTLVFNNSSSGAAISFSGSDSALKITTSGGTIASTVSGITPASLAAGTAVVPSYVSSVSIVGQGSGDVLMTTGWTSTRGLILNSSSTINETGTVTAKGITETASSINLSGTLDARGGGPVAGPVLLNGTIFLNGNTTIRTDSVLSANVTFNGIVLGGYGLTVNAGSSTITTGSSINLSGPNGNLSLNGGTINTQIINTGGGTTLCTLGALSLLSDITSAGPVDLKANQGGVGSAGFNQNGHLVSSSSNSVSPPAVSIRVNTPGGGTGSATIGRIITGPNGATTINTQGSPGNGGAILDGNGTALNVNTGTLNTLAGPGGVSLDTSISVYTANVSSGNVNGSINIRNASSGPLTLGNASSGVTTTNGSITITTNGTLNVGSGSSGVSAGGSGSSVNLTTNSGGGGNINLVANVTGATVNLNADGAITDVHAAANVGPTVITPTANLTARTGIGAASPNVVLVAAPVAANAVTLTAQTNSGGIYATDPTSDLIVATATTNSGPVTLATAGATSTLYVAGTVSTLDATAGNGVTLTSAYDLEINSGSVTAGNGSPGSSDVVLNTGYVVNQNAGTTITSDRDLIVNSPTSATDSFVLFEGTATAARNVAIHGGTGTGLQTIDFSGTTQATAGTVAIHAESPTGMTQVLVDTGGTVSGHGGVAIDDPGAGYLSVVVAGALTAPSGAATITDGNGAQLLLVVTSTGSITGSGAGAINISGGSGSSVNVDVEGTLTAQGAAGTIAITGTTGGDNITIGGASAAVVTAAAGTTIDGLGGSNIYQILPQSGTAITFANTGKSGSDYDQLAVAGGVTFTTDTVSMPGYTIVNFSNGGKSWKVPTSTGSGDMDFIG